MLIDFMNRISFILGSCCVYCFVLLFVCVCLQNEFSYCFFLLFFVCFVSVFSSICLLTACMFSVPLLFDIATVFFLCGFPFFFCFFTFSSCFYYWSFFLSFWFFFLLFFYFYFRPPPFPPLFLLYEFWTKRKVSRTIIIIMLGQMSTHLLIKYPHRRREDKKMIKLFLLTSLTVSPSIGLQCIVTGIKLQRKVSHIFTSYVICEILYQAIDQK